MIKLSKSILSQDEKRAIIEVIDSEYLGMGKQVLLFEKKLTKFFNRPAVCVANGTAALHLACQSIGLKFGDEVLVPSLTYIATFQAVSATGAIPIACDILPDTLTIDYKDAEKRITNKTKAIIPVHYAGGLGDINKIYDFAKNNGLRVIEDAAHAFGSINNDKNVGSIGDIVCFSFGPIKNITCGEGGCIVTENKDILRKVRDARLLGVEGDTKSRFSGKRSWDFDVINQGWRYHMSNIMASIGIEQLKKFSKFKNKRQILAKYYDQLLFNNNLIKTLNHDYSKVVPHIYVVKIDRLKNRNKLREEMLKAGIETGVHWKPNHLLSLYQNANNELPLKETESIYPELITLPLHPDLSKSDIDFVCNTLNRILKNLNI